MFRSNKCGVVCREGRGWDYDKELGRDSITEH